MESAKCALCLNKCTPGIKIAENILNSKGIDTLTRGDKDIPVRDQLQIILLIRKILEVPQEKCCDFLRDYGDPCSWINCCDSCSTLVGECRIIFDQIMKLQRQFEHLQKEIKNIIIRSAKSEDTKDKLPWGRGVQGEMRSFITKGFYYVNPIKEEFVGDLPCHSIAINNEIVAESISGYFPEEIGNTEFQQNSLIAVEKENVSYKMDLMYEVDNCDSEEQDPLQELKEGDDSDSQHDIQNVKVMSEGGYLQSKTTTLGTPFVSHLAEYLPENAISTSSKASMYTEDKTIQCNICGESFSELGNLHDHFCIPFETKPFINEGLSGTSNLEGPNSIHSEENCYTCIQGFNDPKDLNDHIISTQTKNNPMENQYNCDVCDRCFSNYSNLQKHICEKLFSNSRDFSDHIETQTEDGISQKKHKCEFCEKSFNKNYYLKRHERTHIEEKPYKCEFCEKSFNFNYDLKRHERTHTGEKPYKCGFCGNSFSQSNHLRDHERIHTGEKPFKCRLCEKGFAQTSSLKQHERTHTGVKL